MGQMDLFRNYQYLLDGFKYSCEQIIFIKNIISVVIALQNKQQ